MLSVVSGVPTWVANPAGLTNPMISLGDMLYGGVGGTATRVPFGSVGQVPTIQGDGSVAFQTPPGGGGSALNYVNIKTLGSAGNGRYAVGAALAASGNDLTINNTGPSQTVFVLGDVGSVIMIAGADTGGADLWTTIASFVSPTHVTTTASGVTTVTDTETYWGMTDDTNVLQNAITGLTSPTIIYCPAGVYMYSVPNCSGYLYNGFVSVANASGGNTVYTPYVPFGPNGMFQTNSLVGRQFVVWNCTNPTNNGTFTVVANDTTTITLNNPSGVVESFGPGSMQQVNYLVGIVGDGSRDTIWLANNPNTFPPTGFFFGYSNYPWEFSKFRVRGPGIFTYTYYFESFLVGSGESFDFHLGDTYPLIGSMDYDGDPAPNSYPYHSRWHLHQCVFTGGNTSSTGGSVTFNRAQSNQDFISLDVSDSYSEYGFSCSTIESALFDNCLAGTLSATAVPYAGWQIVGQEPSANTGEVSLRNCYAFGPVSAAGFNTDTTARLSFHNCISTATPGPGDAIYGFYVSAYNILLENCYVDGANLGLFISETTNLTIKSNVLIMNMRCENLVDFNPISFPAQAYTVALSPYLPPGGVTFINCTSGPLPSALDLVFTNDTTPVILINCFADTGGSQTTDVFGQGGVITILGDGFPNGATGTVAFVGGGVAVNPQISSYQAGTGDANNLVTISSGSANNFTIPDSGTTAFPVGTTLTAIQLGTGQTTINPLNGSVTLHTPSSLTARAQYSTVSVVQVSSDVWIAGGDLT